MNGTVVGQWERGANGMLACVPVAYTPAPTTWWVEYVQGPDGEYSAGQEFLAASPTERMRFLSGLGVNAYAKRMPFAVPLD